MHLPALPLAHAGGIDELLILVGAPLLLYLGMRLWDRRRSRDQGDDGDDGGRA